MPTNDQSLSQTWAFKVDNSLLQGEHLGGSGPTSWPQILTNHIPCKFQAEGPNGGQEDVRTPHYHPWAGSLDSVSATSQGTKDTNEEFFSWHWTTKATKVTVTEPPRHKQSPLLCTQLRTARKGPQYVSLKKQQCLQPQGTDCPRKSHSTFPHRHNHSALGLWRTCRRNPGLGSLHSPWRPPRLKHVTAVAIQELPRAEMRPINCYNCHHSPRSMQPLQPTGHSGISTTQRAAMARASDLTWGSNQKPQKCPCFRFHIATDPISAFAAVTRKKGTFSSQKLTCPRGFTATPATTGQAGCLYAPQCPSPWTSHSKSHSNLCTQHTLRREPHKWW